MLWVLGKRSEEARPVEARAGIGLAARRDVAMRGDVAQRPPGFQRRNQTGQAGILCTSERTALGALKLDADREIIAARAAAPGRGAGVPGTALDRDELDELAVPADEEVRRHPHAGDLAEILMRLRIEPVGEQALDRLAAEFTRRQADAMHDQQRYFAAPGPRVLVRLLDDAIRSCRL